MASDPDPYYFHERLQGIFITKSHVCTAPRKKVHSSQRREFSRYLIKLFVQVKKSEGQNIRVEAGAGYFTI
jgi:hypothetical protein